MRGPKPLTLTLTADERRDLEALVRRHTTAQQVALRRNDPERDLRLIVSESGERWKGGPKQRQDECPEQRAHQAETQHDRAYIEQPAL